MYQINISEKGLNIIDSALSQLFLVRKNLRPEINNIRKEIRRVIDLKWLNSTNHYKNLSALFKEEI